MNIPVEHSGKRGVTSFTKTAVQRAMDEKAAKWGAPAGYYVAEDRAGIIDPTTQVWRCRVRLFGGSVHHIEDIIFVKEGASKFGAVTFGTTYAHWVNKGGKRIELFKLTERYPHSSLEAAVKWSAEGK